MMRLRADRELAGQLRDHSRHTVSQRRRLLQSVRERGIVVTAREDGLFDCDGRSDQIMCGPSVLLLPRLPHHVSSKLKLLLLVNVRRLRYLKLRLLPPQCLETTRCCLSWGSLTL